MPPYQKTPVGTQKLLGKKGMEVAPDFIDNQCLTRFTDKAIEWITQERDKPFFVYLPFTSPHYPVCPLPEFHGKGDCGGYGEFVIETDHHVGRILAFLEKAGLDKDTMIIYTSDNGPEKSWQNRIEEFDHDSRGRFRGGKRDIYEGGHRVPFFIRWPGGIAKPGRRWDGLIGQVDIVATIAELVGREIPDNAAEDSQSFLPLLQESNAEHVRLPLINHGASGRFSITEGQWKLILPHRKTKLELYDVNSDIREEKNVVSDHPEIVSDLRKKITDIVRRGRTTPGDRQPNDTGYWKDLTWMTKESYEAK